MLPDDRGARGDAGRARRAARAAGGGRARAAGRPRTVARRCSRTGRRLGVSMSAFFWRYLRALRRLGRAGRGGHPGLRGSDHGGHGGPDQADLRRGAPGRRRGPRAARQPSPAAGGAGDPGTSRQAETGVLADLKKRFDVARQIDRSYQSLKRRLGVDPDERRLLRAAALRRRLPPALPRRLRLRLRLPAHRPGRHDRHPQRPLPPHPGRSRAASTPTTPRASWWRGSSTTWP